MSDRDVALWTQLRKLMKAVEKVEDQCVELESLLIIEVDEE